MRLERAQAFLGSFDPLELLRGWETPNEWWTMSDEDPPESGQKLRALCNQGFESRFELYKYVRPIGVASERHRSSYVGLLDLQGP